MISKTSFLLLLFLFIPFVRAEDTSLRTLETFVRSRFEPENETRALPGCGFGRMLDLRTNWQRLSPDLQTKALQLLKAQGPARQKQTVSPNGHFVIHYDTSGYHAVPLTDAEGNGIPDYIDSAAVILDEVWDTEINTLGFRPPPDQNGNPVSVYPVYFTRMSDYGVTWLVDEIQLSGRTIFTSFLELNTSYSGFYTEGLDGLRVTAAHEFNHAIQLGYNVRISQSYDLIDRYFMEMTSTWLEDVLYPEINDYYQYLYFLFDNLSSFSFTGSFSLYPYANALYLHMTEQRYGTDFTVNVWDRIIKEEAIKALDTVLKNKGDTFARSENRYGIWLYFTGERAIPGSYFPDAADYPMLQPQKKETNFATALPGYGLNLFEVNVTNNRVYKAGVRAGSGSGLVNHIVNGSPFKEAVSFGGSQQFEYSLDMNKPVVVLSNASEQKTDSVAYRMWPVTIPPVPNPLVVVNGSGEIVFKSVPQNSDIRIYDVLGRKVRHLKNGGANDIAWNIKSTAGIPAASGIYFYLIDTGSEILKGKFTVIR